MGVVEGGSYPCCPLEIQYACQHVVTNNRENAQPYEDSKLNKIDLIIVLASERNK